MSIYGSFVGPLGPPMVFNVRVFVIPGFLFNVGVFVVVPKCDLLGPFASREGFSSSESDGDRRPVTFRCISSAWSRFPSLFVGISSPFVGVVS